MALIVQKFGGSSVATPEKIINVAKRVIATKERGNQVVAVVSAMGDTTDELLELAEQVTDRFEDREMDMLMSTGEQVSIALLAMAIKSMGHPAISFTGPQAGFLTDNAFRKARILDVNPYRVRNALAQGYIVVVAGFQGATIDGEITTLGRGGSDTTAVALAAALQADQCEIYTDVEGIYTADPRVVPEAQKLDYISYDEMMEMASLGAQVMQLRSIEYAKRYGVEIHVRSTFSQNEGTIIKEVVDMGESRTISGVTHDKKVAKIAILQVPDKPGIAYQIFSALARANVNVDIIIQGTNRDGINDISFTVSRDDLKLAVNVLETLAPEIGAKGVAYDLDVAKVSVVGAGIASNPGIAAAMFGALAEEGINIQMISTSEIKISCIIKSADVERAVRAIHARFRGLV